MTLSLSKTIVQQICPVRVDQTRVSAPILRVDTANAMKHELFSFQVVCRNYLNSDEWTYYVVCIMCAYRSTERRGSAVVSTPARHAAGRVRFPDQAASIIRLKPGSLH